MEEFKSRIAKEIERVRSIRAARLAADAQNKHGQSDLRTRLNQTAAETMEQVVIPRMQAFSAAVGGKTVEHHGMTGTHECHFSADCKDLGARDVVAIVAPGETGIKFSVRAISHRLTATGKGGGSVFSAELSIPEDAVKRLANSWFDEQLVICAGKLVDD